MNKVSANKVPANKVPANKVTAKVYPKTKKASPRGEAVAYATDEV